MNTGNGAGPRVLGREEIHAVLARNRVGRMAYARGGAIHVEPVHYVYSGGWLYGLASGLWSIEGAGEGWWPMAFEVDEVEGPRDWRSVVVHGGFYTLSPRGAEWERQEREKALEILRALAPGTFVPGEPGPCREVVFRIAVQEVSGRAACCSIDGASDRVGAVAGGETPGQVGDSAP